MKRSFLRALVGTTAMVGAAMVALPHDADAALITQGGSTDIYINQLVDGATVNVTGTIGFKTFSATQLVLDFNLTNGGNSGRMVSFGWDFDPLNNATNLSVNNANTTLTPGSWKTTFKDNLSGGFKVDMCVWDGVNCAGGANSGLLVGQKLTGTMTISGNFTSPLNFEGFAGKFQSIGPNGESGAFASITPPTPPPNDVPEPASLALLGLGLLGLGYATRRRRQAV